MSDVQTVLSELKAQVQHLAQSARKYSDDLRARGHIEFANQRARQPEAYGNVVSAITKLQNKLLKRATSADTNARNCGNCMFYLAIGHTEGQCRRFPPTVDQSNPDEPQDRHPITCDDIWCGEFKQKS